MNPVSCTLKLTEQQFDRLGDMRHGRSMIYPGLNREIADWCEENLHYKTFLAWGGNGWCVSFGCPEDCIHFKLRWL